MTSDLLLKSVVVLVALMPVLCCFAQSSADPGATQVLKWKDGKRAAFLLAYDDSCNSHLTNAIPELAKRDLVGTFYTTPATAYQAKIAEWHAAARTPHVELGNHTWSHKGVKSIAELEEDVAKAQEAIRIAEPDRKWPRLVSFARPGGVPWEVPAGEVNALLSRHHLVQRPPFAGPPFAFKTIDEMYKLIEKTIATGEMGHLDFHGVGGDWHVVPMDYYIALLDELVKQRDVLWTTDHITWHKYVALRDAAKVETLASSDSEIRLRLSSTLDPALYDTALTLETRVLSDWKTCTVQVGDAAAQSASVKDAVVRYDATAGEIVLRRQ